MSDSTQELYEALDALIANAESGLATEQRASAPLDAQFAHLALEGMPEAGDTTISTSPVSAPPGLVTCVTCSPAICETGAGLEIPAPVALVH